VLKDKIPCLDLKRDHRRCAGKQGRVLKDKIPCLDLKQCHRHDAQCAVGGVKGQDSMFGFEASTISSSASSGSSYEWARIPCLDLKPRFEVPINL
jgi:hypothetical protein